MIACEKCGSEEVVSATLRMWEETKFRCDNCFEPADDAITVEDMLTRLVKAARRHKASQIDASACGTKSDFDEMHDAEVVYDCIRTSVETELDKRIRNRK